MTKPTDETQVVCDPAKGCPMPGPPTLEAALERFDPNVLLKIHRLRSSPPSNPFELARFHMPYWLKVDGCDITVTHYNHGIVFAGTSDPDQKAIIDIQRLRTGRWCEQAEQVLGLMEAMRSAKNPPANNFAPLEND
jgi:hypothetical protein